MPLLNYTTSVSVQRSIEQIQAKLVAHGASAIMISYDSAEPAGLSFMLSTAHGQLSFRLPSNIKAVKKIMTEDRLRGWNKPGQPARVAWRILKDWIEAQCAIIESEMVKTEEVFLPYLMTPGNKTLYQALVDKRFLLS